MLRTVLLAVLVLAPIPALASGTSDGDWILFEDARDGARVSRARSTDAVLCDGDAPTRPVCTLDPAPARGFSVALPSGFSLALANVPAHRMRLTTLLSTEATQRTFACDVTESPAPSPVGTNGAIQVRCYPGHGSFPPPGLPARLEVVAFALVSGDASDPSVPLDVYRASGGSVVVAGAGRFVVTSVG